MENLYRLSVIVGDRTVDRAVWAFDMIVSNNAYLFRDEHTDLIAAYPVRITYITNIETKEQYEKRKAGEQKFLQNL